MENASGLQDDEMNGFEPIEVDDVGEIIDTKGQCDIFFHINEDRNIHFFSIANKQTRMIFSIAPRIQNIQEFVASLTNQNLEPPLQSIVSDLHSRSISARDFFFLIDRGLFSKDSVVLVHEQNGNRLFVDSFDDNFNCFVDLGDQQINASKRKMKTFFGDKYSENRGTNFEKSLHNKGCS
jgi:hypothetical protein